MPFVRVARQVADLVSFSTNSVIVEKDTRNEMIGDRDARQFLSCILEAG